MLVGRTSTFSLSDNLRLQPSFVIGIKEHNRPIWINGLFQPSFVNWIYVAQIFSEG